MINEMINETDVRVRVAVLENGMDNIAAAVAVLAIKVDRLVIWQAGMIGAGTLAYTLLGIYLKFKLG